MNLGGRGCSEPILFHCTPALATEQTFISKRRKKEKGWELFYANGNQKRAGVAILIAGKIDFNTKSIRRDKECYYVMKKESIQQEDIRI